MTDNSRHDAPVYDDPLDYDFDGSAQTTRRAPPKHETQVAEKRVNGNDDFSWPSGQQKGRAP